MKIQVIIVLLLVAGTAMAQHGDRNGPPPTAAEFVSRLDKNNDGKISQGEFDGPPEHFSQIDANGDGYISEDEVPSGPPPRHPGRERGPRGGDESTADFVTRLDRDGDGKVSRSEFDGPSDIFSELDKDSDGYLSESEAPSGPPPHGPR